MTLRTFLRLVARRWYLAAAGLAATAGLVIAAIGLVPLRYHATSYLLVLPPRLSSQSGGNQFLALGGLQPIADVLARSMSDTSTANKLAGLGVGRGYTITRDLTTAGPVLIITTDESDARTAVASNRTLVRQAAPILGALQVAVGVPANARATALVITPATAATAARKSQLRAELAAGAAGLLLTVLGMSLFDGVSRRRKKSDEPGSEPLVDSDDSTRTLAGRLSAGSTHEGTAKRPADLATRPEVTFPPEERLVRGASRPRDTTIGREPPGRDRARAVNSARISPPRPAQRRQGA